MLGPDAIIGLSTHSEEQIAAAGARAVDYISVGPDLGDADESRGGRRSGSSWSPTPPEHAAHPFFAIGGDRRRATPGRWSAPGRGGSAWCGRSATRPTRPPRRKRCARAVGVAPGG